MALCPVWPFRCLIVVSGLLWSTCHAELRPSAPEKHGNQQSDQCYETENFRVWYAASVSNPTRAEHVASLAELARQQFYEQWFRPQARRIWQPKCNIHLHQLPSEFRQATDDLRVVPGLSRSRVRKDSIVSRRIDFCLARIESAKRFYGVLRHEIAHIALADHFRMRQIPIWAAEGIAVHHEPFEYRQEHFVNLRRCARKGTLIPTERLMKYVAPPQAANWEAFYAQSVSLVDFFVSHTGRRQFVEFLEATLEEGYTPLLQRTYGYKDFAHLEAAWLGEQELGS